MPSRLSRRTALLAASAALSAPAFAQADWRPTRPIRMIVPWIPSMVDGPLRLVADHVSRALGQPMLLEHRPGATGTLGARAMAQEARGDGHLIGQIPVTVLRWPAMVDRAPFDLNRDFTWIIHVSGFMFGVVVRSDSAWQTWEQFLDHARRNAGRVTYGTPGVGSTLHIGMERIAAQHGISWLHVPFRGGADTTQALLSRQIDCVADSTGWAPQVEDGSFRLLVQWGQERTPRFKNVRTLRETGLDMVSDSPWGLAGPKNMDAGVVRVLHDALRDALMTAEARTAFGRLDMPIRYMPSEAYADFVRRTAAEEQAAVRLLGLRAEG